MSIEQGDNCFFEIAGKVGIVKNILREELNGTVTGFAVFEEFLNVESFYRST